jgi:hypothetical protein
VRAKLRSKQANSWQSLQLLRRLLAVPAPHLDQNSKHHTGLPTPPPPTPITYHSHPPPAPSQVPLELSPLHEGHKPSPSRLNSIQRSGSSPRPSPTLFILPTTLPTRLLQTILPRRSLPPHALKIPRRLIDLLLLQARPIDFSVHTCRPLLQRLALPTRLHRPVKPLLA